MFFILFCTLVIALSEAKQPYIPLPQKLINLMHEKSPACVAQTGASSDVIEQFFTIPLQNNESTKKYNLCLFKNMGLADDTGYMYVDKIVALYEHSNPKDIVRVKKTSTECNRIVAENPFETLYQKLQCFSYRAPAWIPY